MFEFFDIVLGYIEAIWSFVVNFFASLAYAIEVLAHSVQLSYFMVGYVPAVIGAAITIFLLVFVLKFVIGR